MPSGPPGVWLAFGQAVGAGGGGVGVTAGAEGVGFAGAGGDGFGAGLAEFSVVAAGLLAEGADEGAVSVFGPGWAVS